jgi:hypothetical protein
MKNIPLKMDCTITSLAFGEMIIPNHLVLKHNRWLTINSRQGYLSLQENRTISVPLAAETISELWPLAMTGSG